MVCHDQWIKSVKFSHYVKGTMILCACYFSHTVHFPIACFAISKYFVLLFQYIIQIFDRQNYASPHPNLIIGFVISFRKFNIIIIKIKLHNIVLDSKGTFGYIICLKKRNCESVITISYN